MLRLAAGRSQPQLETAARTGRLLALQPLPWQDFLGRAKPIAGCEARGYARNLIFEFKQ